MIIKLGLPGTFVKKISPMGIGFLLILVLVSTSQCKKDSLNSDPIIKPITHDEPAAVSALDLSFYPTIAHSGTEYLDSRGNKIELIDFIKEKGVNIVRLRLWHSPAGAASSLQEVDSLAQILKNKGLKVWLCLHYSDTWADPGQQQTPAAWQGLDYSTLKDSLKNYTRQVMQRIAPDIVQIGNEINPGFLHPYGRLSDEPVQFKELLSIAIQEVRSLDSTCKIMLHYAGVNNATWFFSELRMVDFDLIGLSYYPLWHGKDLSRVENSLTSLAQDFPQDIIIAETAYPFTLNWNDWTNNIVGWDEHLILPNYPASADGQKEFMLKIREIIANNIQVIGFSYWGGEMIAFRGDTSSNGSSWENQALFDFNNSALPAWEAFDLSDY